MPSEPSFRSLVIWLIALAPACRKAATAIDLTWGDAADIIQL